MSPRGGTAALLSAAPRAQLQMNGMNGVPPGLAVLGLPGGVGAPSHYLGGLQAGLAGGLAGGAGPAVGLPPGTVALSAACAPGPGVLGGGGGMGGSGMCGGGMGGGVGGGMGGGQHFGPVPMGAGVPRPPRSTRCCCARAGRLVGREAACGLGAVGFALVCGAGRDALVLALDLSAKAGCVGAVSGQRIARALREDAELWRHGAASECGSAASRALTRRASGTPVAGCPVARGQCWACLFCEAACRGPQRQVVGVSQHCCEALGGWWRRRRGELGRRG